MPVARRPQAEHGATAEWEVIARGLGFLEGPVWLQQGHVLTVSLDHGAAYTADQAGQTTALSLGGGPNGASEGRDGRIFIARNGGYCPGRALERSDGGVQAIDPSGRVEWLTRDPISGCDLCFGPEGALYVTDPTRQEDIDEGRIWRCDVTSGAAQILCTVPWFPNGIAFDKFDALFVASTRDRRVYRFELRGARLSEPEEFCQVQEGRPDGLAFDETGRLYVAAVGDERMPGSIQIFTSSGELETLIRPGTSRYYTNIAISDSRKMVVTDADRGELLMARCESAGLPLHPFRNASSERAA